MRQAVRQNLEMFRGEVELLSKQVETLLRYYDTMEVQRSPSETQFEYSPEKPIATMNHEISTVV